MSELPSGTVTFLFTDIEGSTRLWQEQPDSMRPALARHDTLLRDAVEAHDGYVVKTTGDGVHAAFATASDAIAAAIDGQIALGAEPWPLPSPLRVRMGVHTGPAELRDGDYYGTSVNRSARIMAVAHGGQIVLSAVTRGLALGDGIEVVDLGDHQLKDLAEAEQIFQVVHPGLDREFPPLRSLDQFASNLPTQATSFVGREAELDRVVGLLDESRLVTLAGTGGVGKTRLSVQVAAEVVPRFPDGAWFCELAAADDAESMAQVVASTLGCLQHPGLSLAASIVEYLKVRRLLLMLDNCEHLLDEVGDLADAVVRGCPDVTVLATSREALDVTGERVVRLRSLATPESSSSDTTFRESPAVQLFRDRAADAGADASWDARQWEAVGEICRRVDGIPLAIELAAARTVSMSPVDVAGHLDERFRLLTGKRRGRVERHQTLRATVEWSHQLLTDDERLVFDRLGVFAGSFDEPAAVAVAGGEDLDSWTVTDALASLVAKSMVVTETGPAGATRYSMLETLRQFARERLDAAGATDDCRRALALHLDGFARDADLGMRGSDDVLWLARVRADLDNLRATIGWALDQEDIADRELGLSILALLSWVAESEPDLGFGALAVRAVPLAERAAPDVRLPLLEGAAHFLWFSGDFDEARRLAERVLDEARAQPNLSDLNPLVALFNIAFTAGDHERGLQLVDELRSREAGEHDEFAFVRGLTAAATYEAMSGRIDVARADAGRGLQYAQRIGNRYLLTAALNAQTLVLQRDDPEAALAAAEQGLGIQRDTGVNRATLSGLQSLAAGLRARLGDDNGAIALLHDALAVARDDGLRIQASAVLGFAIGPLRHTGRNDAAAILLGVLDQGALAHVAFPGTADGRARALTRIRGAIGDEKTDRLVTQGASMTYDQAIAYALEHLASDEP